MKWLFFLVEGEAVHLQLLPWSAVQEEERHLQTLEEACPHW